MARLVPSDRVLLRLPNWLGDFVMAEPALASLAAALAAGRLRALTLVAPLRFFDLLEGRFEGVARVEPGGDWSGHDVAIFLDGSLRSLLRARSAGIRERWSWSSGGRFLLASESFRGALERGRVPLGLGSPGGGARRLPRPFGAACAELLGLCGQAVVERGPRLASSQVAREAARARLAQLGLASGEPFVLLEASARPGSAKAAPAQLWAQVLEELARRGAPRVLLTTAPGEQELARRALELAPGAAALLFDDPPPTLGELLALVEDCALYLGTDSGPRHLATAVGRGRVVLFGPSDPRHTADHNQGETRLRRFVVCGPCHLERCPLPEPDRGHCLAQLSVSSIVDAVLETLSSQAAAHPVLPLPS